MNVLWKEIYYNDSALHFEIFILGYLSPLAIMWMRVAGGEVDDNDGGSSHSIVKRHMKTNESLKHGDA